MAKVLIMEDDVTQATLLGKGITRGGHDVTLSHSGSEAWELLMKEPFDVLLTDMHVNRKNEDAKADGGLSLIGRVRAERVKKTSEHLTNMRIVAISGASAIAEQSLVHALHLGADVSLFKPVPLAEILNAIEPGTGDGRAPHERSD